jgi:hypothetical protein
MKLQSAVKTAVSIIAIYTALGTSPAAARDAQPCAATGQPITRAGLPVQGVARCVRNPQCRTEIAQRAKRTVHIVSELAIGGAEAVSDLVSDMLEDPRKDDVLKRLDRLEQMLKEEGLYTAEVRREVELMRAAYE